MTKYKRIFAALLSLAGVGAYACAGQRGNGESVGEEHEAIVLSNGVLTTNITLLNKNSFENTAKVVPPSTRPTANCPNGRVALQVCGTDFGVRRLIDANGNIDTSSSPTSTTAPSTTPGGSPGCDNQMVRLKDGSLLAMKGGGTHDVTSPALPYANVPIIGGSPGDRGALFFYRSTDCGNSWVYHSIVDYGTFDGGKYGWPRPAGSLDDKNVDVPCGQEVGWWIGGGDRPEMYACPFTGNIYVTEEVVAGPYCPGGPGAPTSKVDKHLLLMSADNGVTWSLISSDLPGGTPHVMTSTPDGRLFVLSHVYGVPMVNFTQPLTQGVTPILGPPVDASYKTFMPVRSDNATGTRGGMLIKSDASLSLVVSALGGEGTELKLSSGCTSSDPYCTWAYRNGMLTSDADATLAVKAVAGSDTTKFKLILAKNCSPSVPECTWTYKKGEFLSDKWPTYAMNAWGGATEGASVVITNLCDPANVDCLFTLLHVELASGANPSLLVTPKGSATNGAQLKLTDNCDASNSACTFTIRRGMIKSDADSTLAFNAEFGAAEGARVKLSSICDTTNPSCLWTWSKGKLISDGSGSTPLPIDAVGGAQPGAELKLNSACAGGISCLFSVYHEVAALGRDWVVRLSLSRLSTDASTSRVRLVYSSRNGDNMLDARVVNFDAWNTTAPATPVTTIRAANPGTHSVMFPTFVEPDYLDMPKDERTNTAMLYWEEVPTPSIASHDYSAKYVIIDGDSTVSTPAFLSVVSGSSRNWFKQADLGDYVNSGFFWRNKTLNYLAHWIEPNGAGNVVKGNIVTLRSPVHGFLIKSDRDASLAFNAAGGAVNGAEVKLSNICSASNTSCTWSYRNGMIVSDADPALAIIASGGAVEGSKAKLSSTCNPGKAACTWTYKRGEFVSDQNPSFALNAWGGAINGASIVLTTLCAPSNPDCTFTLPNVELSSAQDTRLAMFPGGGAVNGSQLTLSSACLAAWGGNCVFTFTKGMILSGANSSLMLNAAGGAAEGALVKLSSACDANNTSCLWTWAKGEIISDGSSTPLPINAFGGAVSGATLKLNSSCSATNNDCVFAGYYMN